MISISLVIPVFNEKENIAPLMGHIRAVLSGFRYEIVLVDDGSTDGTGKEIKRLAHAETKLVSLKRNYGQSAAMMAGIDAATGEFIATLDGDQQNDPADIPKMIRHLIDNDLDIVAGNRKNRKDNTIRKIPSRIANAIIRKFSGVNILDYGCTLKVYRKEIAKELKIYGELHRFIPILAHLDGARIAQMDVVHHPRTLGKSKYGFGRTTKVISDLILLLFMKKYLKRPIHLFGPLGLVCLSAGFLINLYLLTIKIMGDDIWGRPILILGVTLVLAGIQFFFFGLLAELLTRVYHEAQNKKTYSVREISVGKDQAATTFKVTS